MNNDTPNSFPGQDTDAAIVAMLDEMLAQDNLSIQVDYLPTVYVLVEKTADGETVIDRYDTRAAAYRGGIDCLIEFCIEGWEQGGKE